MKQIPDRLRWFIAALLLVFTLAVAANMAFAQGEPQPGTVDNLATFTIYGPTTIVSGTTNTEAPNLTTSGLNRANVSQWNSADIFFNVDVLGGTVITLTPQFSADQSHWADAYYNFVDTVSTTETVIARQSYQVVVSGVDTVDYVRVPVAGEYMRVQMVVSGTVTPTIWTTLRNN